MSCVVPHSLFVRTLVRMLQSTVFGEINWKLMTIQSVFLILSFFFFLSENVPADIIDTDIIVAKLYIFIYLVCTWYGCLPGSCGGPCFSGQILVMHWDCKLGVNGKKGQDQSAVCCKWPTHQKLTINRVWNNQKLQFFPSLMSRLSIFSPWLLMQLSTFFICDYSAHLPSLKVTWVLI